MTTKEGTKLASKKLLMYGAIVVAAVTLLTVAAFSSETLAQVNSSSTGSSANQGNPLTALPNITGSIPLGPMISGAISSKVKTTLSDAIITAQEAMMYMFEIIVTTHPMLL